MLSGRTPISATENSSLKSVLCLFCLYYQVFTEVSTLLGPAITVIFRYTSHGFFFEMGNFSILENVEYVCFLEKQTY